MHTYRELFRVREFRPLFATVSLLTAARTVTGLALGTLVYAATGSPLLAALSLFGSYFAQVLGAATLLSVADRVPPRAAMVAIAVFAGLSTLMLALPGMPVWGIFCVIGLQGLVGSVAGGVRWGLLGEILPGSGYVLGRSVFNMSLGVTQITGFATGGLLVALTSPRQVLVIGGGLTLAGALTARLGLSRRPPRATGRPSVGQTWRVNAELWSMPGRRHAYLAMWVPNGLVVGCEAIFIPYAPNAAGVLFVAGAAGMLAGDVLLGRFLPARWRARTVTPLQLLLGAPYLLFALSLPLPVAAVAVAAASFGFGGGLLLQERLIELTPPELRGQALGLHSAGMLTFQAVAATIAGAVAGWLPVGLAMAVMGALSLLVALYLTPRLRRRDQVPTPEPVPA
ncbi:MFS transporter [Plantactinospora soyae]|uniref:MFS family arabinose efflux permease n=1 Tax=Plantactinospora soyae TaxID=1544732 RepID=A0A927M6Q8_9ACTN|nr:MFS transporter [Plantactinospora soyae]MBE1487895.1 putative MFS family arabinose efflux permease [Plantactinospora soyae]